MAGAHIQIKGGIVVNDREARETLQRLAIDGQTRSLMSQLGEAFQESTEKRFTSQTDPNGQKWKSLEPNYRKSKHQHQDKILTLRGYLRRSIRYQVQGADAVSVGTNMEYGAIHQLGGTIQKKARQSTLHYQASGSQVGNRFVKKNRSNFWRRVNVGAHSINMPARPYLGLSMQDRSTAQEIIADWLASRAAGNQ